MDRSEILIEADELGSRITDENLRLFDATVLLQSSDDATSYDNYLAGHLPRAAFFDHVALSDSNSKLMFMVPDENTLVRKLAESGISNGNDVIFYSSAHIMWATRAFWLLRYAGHDKVRILNGGRDAWQESGGTLEPAEHHYEPGIFEPNLRAAIFASKEDVLAATEDGNVCTVNTLPHDFLYG